MAPTIVHEIACKCSQGMKNENIQIQVYWGRSNSWNKNSIYA